MRVNVYNEEITREVSVEKRTAKNTGITFYAVRLFMKSHDDLHHTPEDDDRSAITYFDEDLLALRRYFEHIVDVIDDEIDKKG